MVVNKLREDFGELVKIETPNAAKYLLKIVGLPPTSPEEVLEVIEKCNVELQGNVAIHRSYYITNAGGEYLNVVLERTSQIQQLNIENKTVIVGLKSVQTFEYIDLLRCQKFGHSITIMSIHPELQVLRRSPPHNRL